MTKITNPRLLLQKIIKFNDINLLNKLIPIILIASLLILFSKFLEIGMTGDDPFIFMDAYKKGGLLKASIGQAIGQGRFWLALTWTLSQLTYSLNNLLATNIIKISAGILLFYSYFYLLKKLFGLPFAYVCSFVGLMILNIVGGEFNPLFNSPLWYGLGGTIIIWSFIRFDSELTNKKTHFLSYSLFFAGLLFYEIFIFYTFVFPMIYLMRSNIKNPYAISNLKTLLKKFIPLALVIITYLSLYAAFRYFYPSGYPNNQKLVITSLLRTYQTISRLSRHGISVFDWHRWEEIDYEYFIPSLMMTGLLLIGLLISLRKFKYHTNSVPLNYKLLISLVFITFCPNILFGFIDYYHRWGYYVGSFFSGLGLVLITTLLLQNLIYAKSIFKNIVGILLIVLISYATFLNYHHIFHTFNGHIKNNFYKQILIDKLSPQISNVLDIENKVCSITMREENQDAYEIYNFWSFYLSKKTGKNVTLLYGNESEKNCNASIEFSSNRSGYFLTYETKNKNMKFYVSQKKIL